MSYIIVILYDSCDNKDIILRHNDLMQTLYQELYEAI